MTHYDIKDCLRTLGNARLKYEFVKVVLAKQDDRKKIRSFTHWFIYI